MTALYGTFVRLQTMSDGGVRLVLDLGCSLADIAALNLMPGAAFGLARITGESTIAPVEVAPKSKIKPGPLCVMACLFCADPQFLEWAGVANEDEAKHLILETCIVLSRKELDQDSISECLFHARIREPFLAWRDKQ
jgi:hypothetical protein